jgi:hypothetical protein
MDRLAIGVLGDGGRCFRFLSKAETLQFAVLCLRNDDELGVRLQAKQILHEQSDHPSLRQDKSSGKAFTRKPF